MASSANNSKGKNTVNKVEYFSEGSISKGGVNERPTTPQPPPPPAQGVPFPQLQGNQPVTPTRPSQPSSPLQGKKG